MLKLDVKRQINDYRIKIFLRMTTLRQRRGQRLGKKRKIYLSAGVGAFFAEMIPVTVKNKKWELWRTRSLSKDDRVFR